MLSTDAPVVTIGVVIAPPTAVLALRAVAPIVIVQAYAQPINERAILLLVIVSVHSYLARGPPCARQWVTKIPEPAWPTRRAGFILGRC